MNGSTCRRRVFGLAMSAVFVGAVALAGAWPAAADGGGNWQGRGYNNYYRSNNYRPYPNYRPYNNYYGNNNYYHYNNRYAYNNYYNYRNWYGYPYVAAPYPGFYFGAPSPYEYPPAPAYYPPPVAYPPYIAGPSFSLSFGF